jgi:biopolymer transport protein ExbB
MKYIFVLLFTAIMFIASPALDGAAQQPAKDMNQEQQNDVETKIQKVKRDAAFKEAEQLEQQGTLRAVMDEMEQKKKAQDEVYNALKKRYEDMQKEVEQLQEKDAALKKDADGISVPLRSIAQSVAQSVGQSIVSGEIPGRKKTVEPLVTQAQFPSLENIQKMVDLMFDEMARNGTISIVTRPYTDSSGKQITGEVIRIGTFNALWRKDGAVGYLEYSSTKEGFSQSLAKMPASHLKEAAEFADKTSLGLFIDPSSGGAFRFLAEQSGKEDPAMEWIKAAVDYGIIWLLLLLSFIGLWISVERYFVYRKINIGDFPDKKSLELVLTNKLHIIATIGSNAPYLGLMGTVLGIMITFYTMGNEGFMDPGKIMMGLSLALKATAIGLVVAIPSVFFYNLLLRRAKVIMMQWEIENGRERV